jgi:hypothetical protein
MLSTGRAYHGQDLHLNVWDGPSLVRLVIVCELLQDEIKRHHRISPYGIGNFLDGPQSAIQQ